MMAVAVEQAVAKSVVGRIPAGSDGAGRSPQGDNAGGQKGHARGVDRQEEGHGVGRGPRRRVQPVQLLHGPDAERGGGIAETEDVGRQVQDHGAHGRVLGRDLWKQPRHQGPDQAGDHRQQAALLGDLHEPQKERHHADQAEGQLHRAGGGVHHGLGERLHGRELTGRRGAEKLAPAGGDKGDQNDSEEDDVHSLLKASMGSSREALRAG